MLNANMGTEVAISFSSLRTQLENEKSILFKVDENIKKIVQTSGRFLSDRFQSSGDYARGGARPGARHSYPNDGNYTKTDDGLLGKRKQETKTVFSRLSARAGGDSDGEEAVPAKRGRVPSAVSRELPSRAAALQAQAGDEAARTRNRRMFGSLLGTLQRFKQDEITLKNKEEKKAQVERKIEEQARLQKEKEQAQRKSLFAEREQRKAKIKALEAKMGRVGEFERWEQAQRPLAGFILTRARPHLYWLPKVMSDKAKEKLNHSQQYHEKCMSKKRSELQDELQRIEQRVLRRGMGPEQESEQDGASGPAPSCRPAAQPHSRAHRRDKFASEADHHDDSDHDDRHQHKDTSKTKLNSTVERMATSDTEDVEPPPPGTEEVIISVPQHQTNGVQDQDHPNDTTDTRDEEMAAPEDRPDAMETENAQNDPNEHKPEQNDNESVAYEMERNENEAVHNEQEQNEPEHSQ